jgi:hypothetical protein
VAEAENLVDIEITRYGSCENTVRQYLREDRDGECVKQIAKDVVEKCSRTYWLLSQHIIDRHTSFGEGIRSSDSACDQN